MLFYGVGAAGEGGGCPLIGPYVIPLWYHTQKPPRRVKIHRSGVRTGPLVYVAQVKTAIFSLKATWPFIRGNGGRLHCPVHVGRQAADDRSLSICYHEPPFKLDPLKPRVNGPFLVQGGDLGNKGCAVRQPTPVCRKQRGNFFTRKPEECVRCALGSSS